MCCNNEKMQQFVYIKNYDDLCSANRMNIKTTYRKINDWNHRIEMRMQKPVALPEVDHSHHICSHCNYSYDGRCCPQCGMPSGETRFTFKRLIQNFLDIWGLGNRPMFRTIRDLLWRPGYMIRDYLGGHHLSYFPPFKMLAVLTIFIVFLIWVFKFEDPIIAEKISNTLKSIKGVNKNTALAFNYLGEFLIYLDNNDLYRILVQNIFVVFAAWIVFRKKGYNLVETFFSQIYINCQFHIITLVWILIALELPPTVILPYYVPGSIAFFVLIFDYKQLYGLTWKKSFWRTILFILTTFVLYIIVTFIILANISLIESISNTFTNI